MWTTTDEMPATRLRGLPNWLLSRTAAHAQRLVTEGLAAVDARRYHYSLLASLDEFGPASQAELGRRCHVDRSDVVAMVNELADRELVERTPDATDRRRNVITITPKGVQHLRRLDEVFDAIQDALLAPLSADERDQLVGLLTRVLDYHARR